MYHCISEACLRDKHLDPKHANELKLILDKMIKKGKEKSLLPDVSMAVGDPYVLHFLSQLITKVLNQCLTNEILPRDHSSLQLIIRLAHIGANAFQLVTTAIYPAEAGVQSTEYKEPKIEPILYTKFLPSLMTLWVKDQYSLPQTNKTKNNCVESSDSGKCYKLSNVYEK